MGDITELLHQAGTGDQSALDALFTELRPELRRLAHARLARGGRHTLLETTVLINECYLKLEATAGSLFMTVHISLPMPHAPCVRSLSTSRASDCVSGVAESRRTSR